MRPDINPVHHQDEHHADADDQTPFRRTAVVQNTFSWLLHLRMQEFELLMLQTFGVPGVADAGSRMCCPCCWSEHRLAVQLRLAQDG